MRKLASDKCPLCHRRTAPLHTNKVVRQLGVHLEWKERGAPLAVCQPCYRALVSYRLIVLQDAIDEGERRDIAEFAKSAAP